MLTVALCAALQPAVAATLPEAPPPGWIDERWTPKDGLPVGAITGLARTGDGLLWVASYDGLASYDGVAFALVPSAGATGTPGTRIAKIAVHPEDGALWIANDSGTVQRRHGDDVRSFTLATEPVDLTVGRSGLWVTALGQRYALGEAPVPVGDAVEGRAVSAEREDGVLCSPVGKTIVCDGEPAPVEAPAGTAQFARGSDGALVLADARSRPLAKLVPGGILAAGPGIGLLVHWAPPLPSAWAVSEQVLLREGKAFLDLAAPVAALLPGDDEVWVATSTPALHRLHRVPARVVRPAGAGVTPVARLWLDEATGATWARTVGLGWWPVDGQGALPIPTAALPEDEATPLRFVGQLLWRAADAVFDEAGVAWRGPPPASGAYAAGAASERAWLGLHQNLWVADAEVPAWRELRASGGSIPIVRDVLLLPDGTTWLASGIGPLRVPAGAEVANGPPAGWTAPVRQLRADGGVLWLATEGAGLCALNAEASALGCLRDELGPGRATVHASLADGHGRVWLSTNRGIGVADEWALRAFAAGVAGPHDDVPLLWLDQRAGLASEEANGFEGSGAVASPSGTLYFATQDGVAAIDPAAFSLPAPPTVVVAAQRSAEPGETVARVSWTVVARDYADQIAFRTRVDGGSWSAATRDRHATVPLAAPGTYRVEVQARLGGAWGESAVVEIERPAAWHEFAAARAGLAGAGAAGIAAVTVLARRRRRRALEAAVQARTADLREALAELQEEAAASVAPVADPAGELGEGAARVLVARLEAVAAPRLADSEFGVEELAHAVAMSRRNLHRRMTDAGLSAPSRWLLEQRLGAGRRGLRDGSFATVGEAAAAVGLSRAYFTVAYGAWSGHAPGDDLA